MKNMRYILGGAALIGLPLTLQAQEQTQDTTLVRTVVVEQEYNPDIMDASKINVLPQIEVPVVTKKAVEYNETLMPATQIPATTMQPYTGIETLAKAKGGYARLGCNPIPALRLWLKPREDMHVWDTAIIIISTCCVIIAPVQA